MTPALRRRLLTGFAFGFVVILALVLLSDVRAVGSHLSGFAWQLAPLILTGTLFNYGLRFLKWHFFLGRIGAQGLPWRESARVFVAGFPLAVTPGKVGEALKGVWLRHLAGVPVARGVTVVLAERVSDGFAVLALSTLGVLAYPRYWPAFAAVLGLLLAGVIVTQIRPLALALMGIAARLPVLVRASGHLREFYEGAYALFRPPTTLAAVALGMAAWFGEGVAMYLVLLGLGVPGGATTLAMAVFVLSFSTVIGAVSTLPGGLGAAELTMTGMLTLLLGLTPGQAAAAALLIRFATLWFGVCLGLLTWLFSRDLLLLEPADPVPSEVSG